MLTAKKKKPMENRNSVTVVFDIDPEDKVFIDELFNAFVKNEKYKGTTITAMSREDEIGRVEVLENLLTEHGIEYEV